MHMYHSQKISSTDGTKARGVPVWGCWVEKWQCLSWVKGLMSRHHHFMLYRYSSGPAGVLGQTFKYSAVRERPATCISAAILCTAEKWWKKPKVVITFENWKKRSLINLKGKGCERGQEIKRETSQHMTYKLSDRPESDNRAVVYLFLVILLCKVSKG